MNDDKLCAILAVPGKMVDPKYKHMVIKVFCSKCSKDNLYISNMLLNMSKKSKNPKIMCAECINDENKIHSFNFNDIAEHYNIDNTSGEEIKELPESVDPKKDEKKFNLILEQVLDL